MKLGQAVRLSGPREIDGARPGIRKQPDQKQLEPLSKRACKGHKFLHPLQERYQSWVRGSGETKY